MEADDGSSSVSDASTQEDKRKRKRDPKAVASDVTLLKATIAVKPYLGPSRQKKEAWEKIAAEISVSGTQRNQKYCQDRVRLLVSEYRVKMTKKPPTGDAAPKEPTEFDRLVATVDAREQEVQAMSEAQKEKAATALALEDKLEADCLKTYSQRNQRATDVNDDWEDEDMPEILDGPGEDAPVPAHSPLRPARSPLRPGQVRRCLLLKPAKKSPVKFPTSLPRNLKQEQRTDLFREKFKSDAEVQTKELEDKKEDRLLQKEMFHEKLRFEREEKEKDREFQREKEEREAASRREKEEREAAERKADRELMMKVLLESVKK